MLAPMNEAEFAARADAALQSIEQALEDCVTRHDVAAAQGMSGAELAERIRQDQAFLSDTVAGTACRTNPWAAARAGTPEELDRIVTTGH